MPETAQKKKRSWIWTLVFILMNVGILVWTGLTELNRKKTSGAHLDDIQIKWPFFILTVLCFLVTVAAEAGKYFSLIKRLTDKNDLSTAVKVTIYGRYYDNITPSGAGGQPFQIMYLKRRGLGDGAALAIPVYAFLLQQISFVALSLLIFLLFGHLFTIPAIKISAYVGLALYSLVPMLIILSAVFPKAVGRLVMRILRGLAAIRLIKQPEEKGEKVLAQLSEYSRAINFINRHRSLSFEMFLLSLLYHISRASMPFLILHAFGGRVDWLSVTVATFFIYAAISVIPTPGGAGAAEASFYLVFAGLPNSGLVFWAMLVWRFFSDYIFIIGGILLTATEYTQEKLKARRLARQEASRRRRDSSRKDSQ